MVGRGTAEEVRLSRILLDTSVALDYLLRREPWYSGFAPIREAIRAARTNGFVTATSVTDIYYIARRLAGSEAALDAVRTCLTAFQICDVGRDDLQSAIAMTGTDFEDNVQIACALRLGLDAIITRDPDGFRDSPIPAFSPAEAVQRLDR